MHKVKWNGEGLPPVGTVCEFAAYQGGYPTWKECRVIAHDNALAIINYKGNYSGHANHHFRPIRTPEQIAAEERSKECDKMFGVILSLPDDRRNNRSDICEALFDAGYRK